MTGLSFQKPTPMAEITKIAATAKAIFAEKENRDCIEGSCSIVDESSILIRKDSITRFESALAEKSSNTFVIPTLHYCLKIATDRKEELTFCLMKR
jgi:hypothetical protein